MSVTISDIIQKAKIRLGINDSNEDKLLHLFKNKNGLEVGGPSPIFSSELPIYPLMKNLDGCNFSTNTVWEGSIEEGLNYNYYHNRNGYQYILEASNLNKIESGKYDFLLASHCLEHCANPLKTVKEWLRVIKARGYMLLILPDKEYTFDHNRKITSFEHLLKDYNNNIDESDLTHLDEILALHDLSLDTPAGDLNNFRERSFKNLENRCLHHHVFDFQLLHQTFKHFNIQVKLAKSINLNQVIIGRKR
jgi:SAM-dependent methyltransferase